MYQNNLVLSHSGRLLDRYRGLLWRVEKYQKENPECWATATFRLHVYKTELGCPLENVSFDKEDGGGEGKAGREMEGGGEGEVEWV